jgi:hypothetical protein
MSYFPSLEFLSFVCFLNRKFPGIPFKSLKPGDKRLEDAKIEWINSADNISKEVIPVIEKVKKGEVSEDELSLFSNHPSTQRFLKLTSESNHQ